MGMKRITRSYVEQLEWLLYECLVELSYAQEAEILELVASAKGKELVSMGMGVLGLTDLSADSIKMAERNAPLPDATGFSGEE